MRVYEAVQLLKKMNQDAEFKVGMWYGPGAEVQLYKAEKIGEFNPATSDGRYDGPHVIWVAGHDRHRNGNVTSGNSVHHELRKKLADAHAKMTSAYLNAIRQLDELV